MRRIGGAAAHSEHEQPAAAASDIGQTVNNALDRRPCRAPAAISATWLRYFCVKFIVANLRPNTSSGEVCFWDSLLMNCGGEMSGCIS